MLHRYEIDPRPAALGGGWRLRLIEQEADGAGIEVGGAVFPLEEDVTENDAYADALQTGEDWLGSQL